MLQKRIMLQGTASDVGKSVLATALCRIFSQDGYTVRPFKAQNMALNSFTTQQGEEIGRAQAMQAEACYTQPDYRMNPLLLKPTNDHCSQVILNGYPHDVLEATTFYEKKSSYRKSILDAYHSLAQESDIVVLEGAGSPAEINLVQHDLVNMSMARSADAPVLLIADIDRGGVFASLYGTVSLIPPEDRARIGGLIINKFRGDPALLTDGIQQIEELTGIPVLGVIPYLDLQLDDEDSVVDFSKFTRSSPTADLDIVSIRIPYMANFTDINPLLLEPNIRFRFIDPMDSLGRPDLIILLGTKNSVESARILEKNGMFDQIRHAQKQGSCLFGICGGFQHLGHRLLDPLQIESKQQKEQIGLGLLPIDTQFELKKTTGYAKGIENQFQTTITGYELHHGQSLYFPDTMPFSMINGRPDGAIINQGQIMGTYLHGVFENGIFTRNYLNFVRTINHKSPYQGAYIDYQKHKNEQYDRLAHHVRQHLDMQRIYDLIMIN